MGKLKNGLNTVREKLRSYPKGRQGRAFARILQFFALMLVLTIFAKGAAGVTMPEVTVSGLTQQTIRKEDKYTGTIVSTNKNVIELPVGLTVDRVYVSAGSSVKEGDNLVSFDAETVQQTLTAQRIALAELELALKELQKKDEQDDTALGAAQKAQQEAQKAYDEKQTEVNVAAGAVDAALAAYNAAVASKDVNVQNGITAAQQAYDDAVAAEAAAYDAWQAAEKEREKRETELAAAGLAKEDDPLWIQLNADVEYKDGVYNTAKATTLNAKSAKETAASAVPAQVQQNIDSLYAAWESAKQTLTAASSELEPFRKALDEANTALAEAQKDYSEATPSYNLEQQKRKLEIQEKQLEIEKQRKVLQTLQELASSSGTITAPAEGIVADLTVQNGKATTAEDKLSISTGAEGYVVEFSTTREKAGQISMGTVVGVMRTGSYWQEEARVVAKTISADGSSVVVRAQMQDTNWSDGDSVNATVLFSDKQYWNCVPISAVRPDNDKYYVLVLYDEQTILGTQTVARRVEVEVLDQNNEYAAIDGVYENNPRIVVSSTKPVNDGDMVRVDEGSGQ